MKEFLTLGKCISRTKLGKREGGKMGFDDDLMQQKGTS